MTHKLSMDAVLASTSNECHTSLAFGIEKERRAKFKGL